jgi:anti-sigma factor RsiW
MDCRTVRQLADSFLSEQLLVETNHEVLRHLETCDACRAELDARRAIRERLRVAFARSADLEMRPEFLAEITRSLKAETETTVSRRSLLRSWWTAAAGVLLAAGGGLAIRQTRSRSQLTALAMTAAGDHQNCAIRFNLGERPIALEEAARLYGMPYGQMASFQISGDTLPVATLARHSCVYSGHRFAHLVIQYHDAVTSLLVTHGQASAEPRIETTDGRRSVASLPAGDFVAFVVADLPQADVLTLARAIAPALDRHLSV